MPPEDEILWHGQGKVHRPLKLGVTQILLRLQVLEWESRLTFVGTVEMTKLIVGAEVISEEKMELAELVLVRLMGGS